MSNDDGRRAAQYAVDHCVCGYCWGVLIQVFDDDSDSWLAVCADNDQHVGFHHVGFKNREVERHSHDYMATVEFYRQSEYAADFGLTPRLSGAALQEQFKRNRRALGRDDTGL